MIFLLTIILGLLPQVYITRANPAPDERPARDLGEACLEHCGCPIDFVSIEAFLLCAERIHAVTSLTLPAEAFGKPATSSPSSSSSWALGDCYRGGPCDCNDIEDQKSEKYLQCMAEQDCKHCHIKKQTSAAKSSPTPAISSPTIVPPMTTTTATTASVPVLPDNCYIGGPCDCGVLVDKSSTAYFQCVTNPACEHCFTNGTSLTTRSTTSVLIPTTSTATTTNE